MKSFSKAYPHKSAAHKPTPKLGGAPKIRAGIIRARAAKPAARAARRRRNAVKRSMRSV